MKKDVSLTYKGLFLKHIEAFLRDVISSADMVRPVAVAVSGGRDSMALLWTAKQLCQKGIIGNVRAVYVHHQTRSGQDEEAHLVGSYCEKLIIPFEMVKVHGLQSKSGNFEHLARIKRHDVLKESLRSNEWLWLGHHLDDSYEWSFIQQHRSSRPCLGIPVRNKKILRPFLCVTRDQISRLVRFMDIPYTDDPTNLDSRFDRNFLRSTIIPLIKRKYPQYLKHYAYASLAKASKGGLIAKSRPMSSTIHSFKDGAVMEGQTFSVNLVCDLIRTFSSAQRGQISQEVHKMLKAITNQKKGPFNFSGGVEAYAAHSLLMIYRQDFKNADSELAILISKIPKEDWKKFQPMTLDKLKASWMTLLQDPQAMLFMPGLMIVVEPPNILKNFNTQVYDAKFPKFSQAIQEQGLAFISCVKCLERWEKRKTRLPKTLRIVPVWTLSSLCFP